MILTLRPLLQTGKECMACMAPESLPYFHPWESWGCWYHIPEVGAHPSGYVCQCYVDASCQFRLYLLLSKKCKNILLTTLKVSRSFTLTVRHLLGYVELRPLSVLLTRNNTSLLCYRNQIVPTLHSQPKPSRPNLGPIYFGMWSIYLLILSFVLCRLMNELSMWSGPLTSIMPTREFGLKLPKLSLLNFIQPSFVFIINILEVSILRIINSLHMLNIVKVK